MPLALELPSPSTAVDVVISDAAGQTVRQFPLGARDEGLVSFTWDGLDAGGVRAAPGTYFVKVSAVMESGTEGVPTFVQAPVESVTLPRNGLPPVLNLTDIGAVELGAIKRVL